MTADRSNALVVGCLAVVVAGTLAIAAAHDRSEARSPGWDEPPSAYENCLLAANEPGPSGFATEVCEPLSPFWEEPVASVRRSDFAAREDGCLFFTYLQMHVGGEEWGDPGDGEFFCPR